MKDEDKTEEQILEELVQLRERITQLEALETEQMQTEEALRESEVRYHQLLETMNEGLAFADQNYVFTFVNERFCETVSALSLRNSLVWK